jgi:beta-galactosidase GanA
MRRMNILKLRTLALACTLTCVAASQLHAQTAPHIDQATGQFLLNGQPYVMLAGELGNSSSGTAAQADTILPRLAQLHLNTVLTPVPWEQIEPTENHFDFSILDHWIATARTQNLHLVLLWFGSWKNATSGYAPAWVKQDAHRFPRVETADGQPTDILSPLGRQTVDADSHAFAALMHHLHETDATQQTVLMVQVENETGTLGDSRDRSPAANHLFTQPVPPELLNHLTTHRLELSPELAAAFHPNGATWQQVFGAQAGEAFMAYHYARFINAVAAAGKQQYDLPMYVNAQLPAPQERAGEYPSGGPHPAMLPLYRAAASAIDIFAPDIYWPNFEYWLNRYAATEHPVFIPEARLDTAPYNALYAFGATHAFGFSPFSIDTVSPSAEPEKAPPIQQLYTQLDSLADLLPAAQQQNRTAAIVLHASSPRPTQTVALGGYLFHATLARTWPARTLAEDDGAMLILELAPNDFLILGSGLTVTATADPDTQPGNAGILSVDEVSRSNGALHILEHLNGDQTNQNRDLSMDAKRTKLFHVQLYTIPTSAAH